MYLAHSVIFNCHQTTDFFFVGVDIRKKTNARETHVIKQSSLDSSVALGLRMQTTTNDLSDGILSRTRASTTIHLPKILELTLKTAVSPQLSMKE